MPGTRPGMTRKNAEMQETTGAAEGIRTPDPRITNAVLYQLSYRGPFAVRRPNTRKL
jgi:hypothetical protein